MTSREQMLEKIKSALYYAALPGDDAEIPTLAADLLDELEAIWLEANRSTGNVSGVIE